MILLTAIAILAGAYQFFAILACLFQRLAIQPLPAVTAHKTPPEPRPEGAVNPTPVSILKPAILARLFQRLAIQPLPAVTAHKTPPEPRPEGAVNPTPVSILKPAILARLFQRLAIQPLPAVTAHKTPPEPRPEGAVNPTPVSILKPILGADAALRGAIASHSSLEGDYELLCGVASLSDPAVAILNQFPRVRVIECPTRTPNGKAGVLIDLAAAAKNPILIVNDADIRVEPDYLARVTAPLADPRVGLVTCLYRPCGETAAARFEGLGVSTDFAPSTLVARWVGVDEFALGSTLAFRRADLDRIGGFRSVADYLADDYQLGHRLHALGLKCVLSDVIVETHLGGGWGDVWRHQIRWARTIRVSKFAGYLGLPVTFATFWAVLAAALGRWEIAAALLAARMAMALVSGWLVIRSRDVLRLWWAVPVRDLAAAAVWFAALFGNSVEWRGRRLKLDRDGRITR